MTDAVYRFPPTTVMMGTVLDLQIQVNPEQRLRIDEWDRWLMCCGENGFDLPAGRAKLFLFAPALDDADATAKDRSAAARAHARWHKRDAERVDSYDVPDECCYYQGRVLRIGYRSSKWGTRKQEHDYDHDFCERGGMPPKLYTNTRDLSRARGAVVVGGDMVIREGGIS